MRLFEVDQGSARDVLAVLQGLANKAGDSASLPFPTVMNMLKPFGLGISTPDGLIALKFAVDPQGDVIRDISADGTVVLNTDADNPDVNEPPSNQGGAGPNVEKMAKSNSKNLKPNI